MAQKGILAKIADEKHELEMTPMIDVTFLLLIFFMCTLKFKVLEGKLGAYLPKDVGAQSTPQEEIEKFKIQLRVLNEGTKMRFSKEAEKLVPVSEAQLEDGFRFEYGDDRRIEYTMGSYATTDLEEVRKRLSQVQKAAIAAGEDSARVEIDPRERTINRDVVRVLDVVIGEDIREINFSGSFEK
ncbi:MAG: biopolymer transporter ExbD [Planctomycetota bacterium]